MARHRLPDEYPHTFGRHSMEHRHWNYQMGTQDRPRSVKELLKAHAPHMLRRVETAIETTHRVVSSIYDEMVNNGLLGIERIAA